MSNLEFNHHMYSHGIHVAFWFLVSGIFLVAIIIGLGVYKKRQTRITWIGRRIGRWIGRQNLIQWFCICSTLVATSIQALVLMFISQKLGFAANPAILTVLCSCLVTFIWIAFATWNDSEKYRIEKTFQVILPVSQPSSSRSLRRRS